jgi:hypothetical protein
MRAPDDFNLPPGLLWLEIEEMYLRSDLETIRSQLASLHL